jgi:serine/threonine protein kinase
MDPALLSDIPLKVDLLDMGVIELAGVKFEALKKLGEGGFATVYLVRDSNGVEKAIKILNLYKVAPSDYLLYKRRVRAEFKAGKLIHPHLVHYKSIGVFSGNPYLLMEYCPGERTDLQTEEHRMPLPEGRIVRILQHVAKGMGHLHEHKIVHRDIKPENILLGSDHCYKLSDFGISAHLNNRMTEVGFWGKVKNGEVFGSPFYSPVEQLSDRTYYQATDKRMDIYSFGMLAHSLLYPGDDPFGGQILYNTKPEQYIKNKKNYNPKEKEIPIKYSPLWWELLQGCLQKEAGKRYKSAAELLEVLHQILGSAIPLVLDEVFTKGEKTQQVWMGRNTPNFKSNTLDIGRYNPRDCSISKRHATLLKEDQFYSIRDGQEVINKENTSWKSSLNGLYLNGERLGVEQFHIIKRGDLLKIGGITFWIS